MLIAFAVGPAGRLFISEEESGVYASRDGGRTWSWSGVGMGSQRVRALAADPVTGALYAVGDARIFRSTDAGESWQALAAPLPLDPPPAGGDVLALAPGEPPTIFHARGARLFRGVAGGTSWQEVFVTPISIAALLVDPHDPLSVFAGTKASAAGAYLWHSADGGSSWKALFTRFDPIPGGGGPPFSYGTKELAASPGDPAALFAVFGFPYLYRSFDAGASWHLAPVPHGSSGGVFSLAVAPGPPVALYANFGEGLFASRDLGTTWEAMDEGKGAPGDLHVDPATGKLYAVGGFGVARSDDGGAHWHQFLIQECVPLLGPQLGGKLHFPARSASRVYAVSDFHLLLSDDGGASWSGHPGQLSDPHSCAAQIQIRDLALDPRRGDTIYAATDQGISRSTDAGSSWQSLLGSPREDSFPFNTVAVLANGTLLAGGGGAWRSTDAGTTWHQTFADGGVLRLILDPSRPQVVYAEVVEAGDYPAQEIPLVFRSLDGGRSWQSLPVRANVIAVDPRFPETLYVLGPSGLLQSRDDGRTWRRLSGFALEVSFPPRIDGDLIVDPFDSRMLWAARPDGVWQSADGGVTWQPHSVGLRGRPALSLFPDARRGQLAVASEGFFAIPLR
ncbi:MAG TPA: hypothetical protein VHR45_12810 [Thermoanaerobaculia bacterium]|nr:hypothetical protein [Thermoanaerobaculia bacterium]